MNVRKHRANVYDPRILFALTADEKDRLRRQAINRLGRELGTMNVQFKPESLVSGVQPTPLGKEKMGATQGWAEVEVVGL